MHASTTLPLTSTTSIPLVGFGTYLIPNDEAASSVMSAIGEGYRHIDTAEIYNNERGVGEGIAQGMAREGLERDDLFITTKLWPGNAQWGQEPKTTQTTLDTLDRSLRLLNLDHVDLYLIHAPFDPAQRLAQWEGLLELQRQGKARAIGVSNFSVTHLEQLREAGLPTPSANQIELHPWSRKPELIAYMKRHDITPIAYSSLVPLSTWRRDPGHKSAKTEAMQADSDRGDSPFAQIARKHGVSEAQVLLKWGLTHQYPILPKSTKIERQRQNIDLFSFTLDQADMDQMDDLDRGDGIAWSVGDPLHFP